jgi:hypothetical protein
MQSSNAKHEYASTETGRVTCWNDRYLAMAQAELQAGDKVAAENYYQHAEHYFRLMSSDSRAT